MTTALDDKALAALFTAARTHNGWADRPVGDETLRELYDLTKMGPTSANCSPGRFVFVRSQEAKENYGRRFRRAISKRPWQHPSP